ncbi:MAG TPA: guanylate kinase [Candidatus Thioglobus sp.]|jgi:guanylate kinase|nr:guanylate kinase [Candidatus Thioglobus sp.]HIL21401.1 guanylate kinase [Candidatus Thioglobus sp.]
MANIFIISAPSGCGKTSLVKALLESMSDLCASISHTTRTPRPGEVDGENYHFVSKEKFNDMCSEGAFVEHAEVFGNYYGSAKKSISKELEQNKDVILEIDWQGAQQVKQNVAALSIFILPPTKEALLSRLQGRGQDSQEIINKRMADAESEMSHFYEFDFVVFNDDFDTALEDLKHIIFSARLTLKEQSYKYNNLLKQLI